MLVYYRFMMHGNSNIKKVKFVFHLYLELVFETQFCSIPVQLFALQMRTEAYKSTGLIQIVRYCCSTCKKKLEFFDKFSETSECRV